MKNLDVLMNDLQSQIPHHQRIEPGVSSGSIGWHIEHTLLTMNLIIKALKSSNPEQYQHTFNLKRSIVSVLGKIPRGKIKAPASVQPTVQYNEETLRQHFFDTIKNLESLKEARDDQYFTHPFLGDFKLKPTKRFLQIHTNHHVKIIHDIMGEGK
jgi:hypothetical protein